MGVGDPTPKGSLTLESILLLGLDIIDILPLNLILLNIRHEFSEFLY